MNNDAPYMTLTDADGKTVAAGHPDSNHVYTVGLEKEHIVYQVIN